MVSKMGKIPQQIVQGGINHCGKHFCLCVEYLDFGKKKDRERYKHCYITQQNNEKYEIEKKNPTYDEIIKNYLSYQ